jgi:hypothetical protein
MSETERAIEYLREITTKYDRLKAELDRLTTLRPMSDLELHEDIPILWFNFAGRWHHTPYGVGIATHWTPLPEPKEADK